MEGETAGDAEAPAVAHEPVLADGGLHGEAPIGEEIEIVVVGSEAAQSEGGGHEDVCGAEGVLRGQLAGP